jgi:hypothetical protein
LRFFDIEGLLRWFLGFGCGHPIVVSLFSTPQSFMNSRSPFLSGQASVDPGHKWSHRKLNVLSFFKQTAAEGQSFLSMGSIIRFVETR